MKDAIYCIASRRVAACLDRHPLIGSPAKWGLRDLVISRGRTGYVALYSVEDEHNAVLVLAIRHQREAGYLGLAL